MVIVWFCLVGLRRFLKDLDADFWKDVMSEEEKADEEQGKRNENPLGDLP